MKVVFSFFHNNQAYLEAPKHGYVKAGTDFLKKQYLTPSGSISSVAGRDIFLRVIYNATIFTVYGAFERSCVSSWPENLQWPWAQTKDSD
jgi:hypothetical protein